MRTLSGLTLKHFSNVQWGLLCLVVVWLCLWAGPVPAAERDFYQGKTIRVIVPFSPGGGFDMLSRLMARHLPKYIPGKPGIFVQNMPGGGNTIGVNYVNNVAKHDGLTIGLVHGNKIVQQMTKMAGIKFDITKFHWMGSVDLGPISLGIRKDLPYRTGKDIQEAKKTLYMPASVGSNGSDYPLILNKFAGMNLKPVHGYNSMRDAVLALQQREGDGRAGSLPTLRRYPDLLRIVVSSKRGRKWVPGVTVDRELVTEGEGRALIDALQIPQRVGRGIYAPPGVPKDRVAVLKAAWEGVMRDPVFVKEAEKILLVSPGELVSAREVEEVISRAKALPAKTWEQLIELRKAGLK